MKKIIQKTRAICVISLELTRVIEAERVHRARQVARGEVTSAMANARSLWGTVTFNPPPPDSKKALTKDSKSASNTSIAS